MNTQKKRIAAYFLFVCLGFLTAFLLLRNKSNPSLTATLSHQETSANRSGSVNLFFDFETGQGLSTADNVKETTAHSGKKACNLSGGKEYGPSVNKKLKEIGSETPKRISMSVWVYPLTDNVNVVLTASVVNSKNETVFWEGKSSENKSFPKNKWTKINASYILPVEKISANDVLRVGIWNKGKTDVIIDDLEIVYGEAAERRGVSSKIEASSIYEKRFVSEMNKPPFRTIYFEKQEINNANSSSITFPDKSGKTDKYSPNDQFIAGDFFIDKNNLDELLCVGSARTGLFSYSTETRQFKKLWEARPEIDSMWNKNNTIYSGHFNSDSKLDVLIVNKNNNDWSVLNFDGKKWNILSQGNTPKKEWITKKETPEGEIINPSDILLPGNYFGNKQTFLKLNTDWRFDLKLIEQDGNRYTILGNVDFKGYPDDHNPKYYEFVKIVPGRFLSKDQTALVVVMFNCADPKFDGKNCEQTEDLSFLPNSIQLYRIEDSP